MAASHVFRSRSLAAYNYPLLVCTTWVDDPNSTLHKPKHVWGKLPPIIAKRMVHQYHVPDGRAASVGPRVVLVSVFLFAIRDAE